MQKICKLLQYNTLYPIVNFFFSIKFPSQQLYHQIMHFPYCVLPNIPTEVETQINTQQINYLKVFKCLTFQPNEKLQKLAQQLLGETDHQIDGQSIFNQYFGNELQNTIKTINNYHSTNQQKIICWQILVNMQDKSRTTTLIEKINIQPLVQSAKNRNEFAILQLTYYLRLLIFHDMNYLTIVDTIHCALLSLKGLQQNRLQTVQHACRIMLTIPSYDIFLPDNLLCLCLDYLIENVYLMHAFQLLIVLRYLYNNTSPACVNFINELTKVLLQIQKQGPYIDYPLKFHIPLFIKVLKMRVKLNLPRKEVIKMLMRQSQKFWKIFMSQYQNKEVILDLLNDGGFVPYEFQGIFAKCMKEIFEKKSTENQMNEEQMLRNIKLVLKYYHNFSEDVLYDISKMLLNDMLPRYTSIPFTYYVILLLLRGNHRRISQQKNNKQLTKFIYSNKNQIIKLIDQIIKAYPIQTNPSQNIEIIYQLYRIGWQKQLKIPSIFKLTSVDISLQTINLWFYLIPKVKENIAQKQQAVQTIKSQVEGELKHKSIRSMKILYTIINGLAHVKWPKDELWMEVEWAFVDIMAQIYQSRDYNSNTNLPLKKDLHFLKERILNCGCSHRIYNFIVQSLKNYDQMKEIFFKNYGKYCEKRLKISQNKQQVRPNLSKKQIY